MEEQRECNLRRPTHFLGVFIFYLWTDPAEIDTEYVKLKKITFCSWKFFWIFGIVFEKMGFFFFFSFLVVIFKFSKE